MRSVRIWGSLVVLTAAATARAQEVPPAEAPRSPNATELSKEVENPIADLISVPFQNNFNFGIGPENKTQYLLNIQPVIPMGLPEGWMLVHRPVIPLLDQPGPALDQHTFGLGDILYTAYISPPEIGPFMVGVGPAVQLPTGTSTVLGTGKWAVGPTVVVAAVGGPWVGGLLATQIWSVGGETNRADINGLQAQGFLFHNLPKGWAIGTAPLIYADWTRSGRDVWTLPLGAQLSKVLITPGGLPLQLSAGGYWNVLRPTNGPDAQLRVLVAVLLPR